MAVVVKLAAAMVSGTALGVGLRAAVDALAERITAPGVRGRQPDQHPTVTLRRPRC